ncbi:MAG: OmpA family protein [Melioribacteraceae bacterium]
MAGKRPRRFRKIKIDDAGGEEHSAGAERYLLTYADLITLLLGLFIILYAVSNVDAKKYEAFMGEAGNVFGSSNLTILPFENTSAELNVGKESIRNSVEGFIKEFDYQNNIKLIENERGFIISILDNILFTSGKAKLSEESKPILKKIAQLLKTLPNDIRVEGHTDDIPISTAEFPSNWHLSIARATNTAYYLMNNQGLNQEKVAIVGNAEFKPVTTESSPEMRSLNRRVDIVILKE